MQPFSQCHVYIAENVLLDSRLALFHEEEKWLAVADLHFGFELSQRMAGNLVPLWGMQSIEARLCELLRDYQPSHVKIGRASCRERVQRSVVVGSSKYRTDSTMGSV